MCNTAQRAGEPRIGGRSIKGLPLLFKGFRRPIWTSYNRKDHLGKDSVIPPFDLRLPRHRTTSVIFASPHSGCVYPQAFLRQSALSAAVLRSSEDAFVDQLFETAPSYGAPFLVATYPRAWVDLNRAQDELDAALIEGVRRNGHNPRIASGLGVVPRVVSGGRPIYRGKISLDEARARIRDVWRPYHAALHQQLVETRATFGEAILIDCHSMPHEAIEPDADYPSGARGPQRPDVVLGDRFGAAASGGIVDRIEAAFAAAGLRVSRNTPFAGAFITQHYGRPTKGQHVVQVEIDRALYMDEARVAPHGGFARFKRLIDGVVAELADIGRADQVGIAAE